MTENGPIPKKTDETGEPEKTEEIEEIEETKKPEETEEKNETDENIRKKLKEAKKEINKLHSEYSKKAEEYDLLYDKYLRISAEYDNFRKRTAKEKEGIYSESVIDVLNNILPVADNIERALQFSESEKVLEGLKMIYSQFKDSLLRLGVEEINPNGELFNPEFHNAVFHDEDETKPENTVTETLQKGYIKGDKIIRPAIVKVVN